MNTFETAKEIFLDGLRLLENADFPAAEIQFTRSLELLPDRVSTLNNLEAVKLKLNKFTEAEAAARKAISLEEQSPEAWINLGMALSASNRPEAALSAYEKVLHYNPTHAGAWLSKARTLFTLKQHPEALAACGQAEKLQASAYETLYTKSQIHKALGRLDEAQTCYQNALSSRVEKSPAFITERRASQKAKILIVNPDPVLDESLKPFELLHLYCSNFPGQLYRRFKEKFHFIYVFESDAALGTARWQIPQPDIVLNNCANGERLLTKGRLASLSELVDSFGVPVINHPSQAVTTTRDVSAKLVADLPGVIVPQTQRFSAAEKAPEEIAQNIETQFTYPFITRHLAMQMGKGMTKVDSRAELVELLSSGEFPEEFFITQFVDSRHGSPLYRKIRAAFIQDEIIISRVDFSPDWNVRGRKTDDRVAFYLKNSHLLAEEQRLCSAPETHLGTLAMQSLRAIRQRINLDIFGLDFDVDAAGRVVFHEANATMNLFSTASQEAPNPESAEIALRLAFENYFDSLTSRY